MLRHRARATDKRHDLVRMLILIPRTGTRVTPEWVRLKSHTLSAEMCMAYMLHTNLDFISQRGGKTISSGQAPQRMLRPLWPPRAMSYCRARATDKRHGMNFDPNLLGRRACDTQMGSHIWTHLDHRLKSHILSAEMCMAHMLHTNLDFISQRGGKTISSGQVPQSMMRFP